MATTFSPLAPQQISRIELQRWLSTEGAPDTTPGAAIKAALELLAYDRIFYEMPSEVVPYLARVEQQLTAALQELADAKAAMG